MNEPIEINPCPSGLSDLSGARFAHRAVLGFHKRNGKRRYWWCRCNCGAVESVRDDSLARSCMACSRRAVTAHGMSRTPEFAAWSQMISRCTDSNRHDWQTYGGRGIAVCRQWLQSFESFLYAMGPRPSPNHSLDRYPNHEGNYAPNNCRWATRSEQARNRRSTLRFNYRDEFLPLPDLCDLYASVRYSVVLKRLHRGWPIHDALTKPLGFRP